MNNVMNGNRRREHRHAKDEPAIVSPRPDEVRAALEGLSLDLAWPELRDHLRPVFVRRRPLPPGMTAPLIKHMEPGLDVALGADIGPAFLYVSAQLLDSWPLGVDEAFEIALANLRGVIEAERYFELAYEPVDGVPVWWYQSHGGLASGLLLLQDILAERYGDQPRVLMAPMRNLLLAAPYEADREVMGWLRDEIAAADPNGLDLPLFVLVDGRLSVEGGSVASDRQRVH
ncbi:MAG: hypothetical protein QOJ81_20 [Chloroflexota bacterium]|jgi:hypothetical protein|nr:hypothetical protein [Chloroflexota bacterium]